MKHNGIVYDVTGDYDTECLRLAKAFQEADAVIVGAGRWILIFKFESNYKLS